MYKERELVYSKSAPPKAMRRMLTYEDTLDVSKNGRIVRGESLAAYPKRSMESPFSLSEKDDSISDTWDILFLRTHVRACSTIIHSNPSTRRIMAYVPIWKSASTFVTNALFESSGAKMARSPPDIVARMAERK